MKEFPDKFFDLAVVDPPYGGGSEKDADKTFNGALVGRFGGHFEKYGIKASRTSGTLADKYGKNITHWDIAPGENYFKELFRVSKNQIIWGGKLLFFTSDKVLSCVEETNDKREFHNGYV